MVQLTPEIGQCLLVARLRPERTTDPLTLDWTAAGMQDEEGDELLLSRADRLRERTAVGEDTEATEQFDAEGSPTSHGRILSQRSMPGWFPRPGELVIAKLADFPRAQRGGGLKNRCRDRRKNAIEQVVTCRILTICGEVAERL